MQSLFSSVCAYIKADTWTLPNVCFLYMKFTKYYSILMRCRTDSLNDQIEHHPS